MSNGHPERFLLEKYTRRLGLYSRIRHLYIGWRTSKFFFPIFKARSWFFFFTFWCALRNGKKKRKNIRKILQNMRTHIFKWLLSRYYKTFASNSIVVAFNFILQKKKNRTKKNDITLRTYTESKTSSRCSSSNLEISIVIIINISFWFSAGKRFFFCFSEEQINVAILYLAFFIFGIYFIAQFMENMIKRWAMTKLFWKS